MARYLCEMADHEAQSHTWLLIGDEPESMVPACPQVVDGAICHSLLHECSWCDKTATARAFNETGRLLACDAHASYLPEIGTLPTCEECGERVAWPTEWFCAPCADAIDRVEVSL